MLRLGLKQVLCNSIFGLQHTWIVSEMVQKIWKQIANLSTKEKPCQTFCKVVFFPKLNIHSSCILVRIVLQVSLCPAVSPVSLGCYASVRCLAPWICQPGLEFSF